uniref:Kelch repeat protein n=1 Tax=Rhabditophanes sp. KR3021 TaxID=114890 RepID=A0AC35TMV1_9BILA
MILASHSEKFYLLFCENPKQVHFKDSNMKLKDFEVYYEYLHLDTHFKVDGDKMVSIMKVQAALQVYDLRVMQKMNKYDLEKNVSDVSEFRMSSRKGNYSSVLVSKQIYVIGGRLNSQSIDIVEYFDCENMKWYNAPKLLGSFSHHDSVEVDEAIYVVGDYKSQKFQRFDRREGKWSFLSDIPMKAYCTAMSSCDQRITCLGGGSMARLTRQTTFAPLTKAEISGVI